MPETGDYAMVMNPLGPLIEKTAELSEIGANILTAGVEIGGLAVGAAVEFTKDTSKGAAEKGFDAANAVVNLGHAALDTTVDVSKAGLRIPSATIERISDLGTDLVGFASKLLPALGDREKK